MIFLLIYILLQDYCIFIQVLTNILNFNYIFWLHFRLIFEVFIFLISKAHEFNFCFQPGYYLESCVKLYVCLFCKLYFNLQFLILFFSVYLPLINFSQVSDTSFIHFSNFISYLPLSLDLSLYNHFKWYKVYVKHVIFHHQIIEA